MLTYITSSLWIFNLIVFALKKRIACGERRADHTKMPALELMRIEILISIMQVNSAKNIHLLIKFECHSGFIVVFVYIL